MSVVLTTTLLCVRPWLLGHDRSYLLQKGVSVNEALSVCTMPRFENTEKTDMVLLLGECRGNKREAVRKYALRYPHRQQPSENTFTNYVKCLRRHGGFASRRAPRRNRIIDDEDTAITILALIHTNPHISSRAIARELGISQPTVLNIIHQHSLHPYHIHLHQALSLADQHRRIEFCLSLKELLLQDNNNLADILWSDEATFHRDGTVNRHNMHYWSQHNPFWLRQNYFQVRWKTNVWVGILGDRILGPKFFNEPLTGERYLEFLNDEFTDMLDELPLGERRRVFFQQDGAPPHYLLEVRHWLDREFPQRWIGRGGPVVWPPRSQDLTTMGFFLWGYVTSEVYVTEPASLQELPDRIRDALRLITPQMIHAVRGNLLRRLDQCLHVGGGHFEHVR